MVADSGAALSVWCSEGGKHFFSEQGVGMFPPPFFFLEFCSGFSKRFVGKKRENGRLSKFWIGRQRGILQKMQTGLNNGDLIIIAQQQWYNRG